LQKLAEISNNAGSDEQRRDPRIATNDLASIRLLSTLEKWEVRVLDVSRNGFRIYTPRFMASEAVVEVTSRNSVIRGEVRYCVQTEEAAYPRGRMGMIWPSGPSKASVSSRTSASMANVPILLNSLRSAESVRLAQPEYES